MAIELNIFNYIKDFLKEKTGIVLETDRSYLVESRLLPVIKSLNLINFSNLVIQLKTANKEVENAVIDALTTNETLFFRDIKPFEYFEKIIIPKLVEKNSSSKTIRIWSAACSSGQEPYSLAMMMEERYDLKNFKIEILATDVSRKILDKAKAGIFSQFEVQRGLPIKYMMRYFAQTNTNNWQINPVIKEKVTFREFNLMEDSSLLGSFDCIFCRNVLIYFDQNAKLKIINNLTKRLNKESYLILGSSETQNLNSTQLDQDPETRSIFIKKV